MNHLWYHVVVLSAAELSGVVRVTVLPATAEWFILKICFLILPEWGADINGLAAPQVLIRLLCYGSRYNRSVGKTGSVVGTLPLPSARSGTKEENCGIQDRYPYMIM